ncbi:hypothetical protein SAMN06265375_1094 [Muriicola jejuensis]|uniref:DUF3127 domain-containing protein n=1 Tax=Muriicola jejuensis TaxID=504488 RepID=A0A6P0UIQ6_9FLAO|nr:hypothetical protein [Muriicola jejuensis]NER11778.1 hypothetical protein [Muriicola jejuensis]SMP26538.1 hypothetical protein SAMN06265375_1094 [Muriicola jejuensis]
MKVLLLLVSVLSLISIQAQELDCNRFKTGNFIMEDPNTGQNIIKRTDSTQIEYLPNLGIKIELNAKWQDDCTLILTLHEILENPNNHEIGDFVLISEVIETTQDFYVMRSYIEGQDFIMTRKFQKID